MKFCATFSLFALVAMISARGAAMDDYRQLSKVDQLPVSLDPAFQFRKTKVFFLGDPPGQKNKRAASVVGGVSRDPAVGFETSYRLYGAVTELDKRRRYGNYFDFFWRARRPAAVTVRLEYQQEKLRTFTQAREVSYRMAKGSHKTSFAVIGDDFTNDGRVLAWRGLLIENGRIVAEERSFLWR
jgi:hypothetical protein